MAVVRVQAVLLLVGLAVHMRVMAVATEEQEAQQTQQAAAVAVQEAIQETVVKVRVLTQAVKVMLVQAEQAAAEQAHGAAAELVYWAKAQVVGHHIIQITHAKVKADRAVQPQRKQKVEPMVAAAAVVEMMAQLAQSALFGPGAADSFPQLTRRMYNGETVY
jgi:hypothetical protein